MRARQRPSLHFIRQLCADLSEAEIAEAEERFWRYLDILRDIARHKLQNPSAPTADLSATHRFDKSS